MSGPWFFLLIVLQALTILTSSSATILSEDDSPSCDDLRSFWNELSRSERASQLTNQIPVMPWDEWASPRRAGSHRKTKMPAVKNVVKDIFTEDGPPSAHLPPYQFLTSNPKSSHINTPTLLPGGHFGDFAGLPQSAKSPSLWLETRKKDDMPSNDLFESWGLPEDVGMFGSFVDGDIPQMTSSEWSRPAAESTRFNSPSLDVMRETCLQILNKDCTVDRQCTCIGWNTLKCVRGKCNSLRIKTTKENEHGSWHPGPLPHSELGRQKRRKNEYTLM